MIITTQHLKEGLINLRIQSGDTIEVHSSLSSFGHVEDGADTVIDALISTIGPKGTILMSASQIVPLTNEDREMELCWKVKIMNDTTINSPTHPSKNLLKSSHIHYKTNHANN